METYHDYKAAVAEGIEFKIDATLTASIETMTDVLRFNFDKMKPQAVVFDVAVWPWIVKWAVAEDMTIEPPTAAHTANGRITTVDQVPFISDNVAIDDDPRIGACNILILGQNNSWYRYHIA